MDLESRYEVERAFGFGRRVPAVRKADDVLLARVPALSRLCRDAVLFMGKAPAQSAAGIEQSGEVA
jgi:hypothetical protein